jgi:SLT domain-containing protein
MYQSTLTGQALVNKLNKNDAFATMAKGGIVTDPTMALIGEAGPEAVIPLSNMGGMGSTYVTVNVSGSVTTERDLVDAITQGIYNNQASGIPINYSTVY